MLIVPSPYNSGLLYTIMQFRTPKKPNEYESNIIHIQVREVYGGNRTWGHAFDATALTRKVWDLDDAMFNTPSLNILSTMYITAQMRPKLIIPGMWTALLPTVCDDPDDEIYEFRIKTEAHDHLILLEEFRRAVTIYNTR